jgi:hypothetical protein
LSASCSSLAISSVVASTVRFTTLAAWPWRGDQEQVHDRRRDQRVGGGRDRIRRSGRVAPCAALARRQDGDVEQPPAYQDAD